MTIPSTPSIEQQQAAISRAAPPDLQGWPKFWLYLILATFSILNAGWILSEAGVTFSRCFSPNDTHRRQAAAMLDGHFWLSKSIFDTQFDNCYVNGKVQQVWGLGVPMYLIPFELFGRAIGVSPFPDRIAMGVMLAAFFFYCGTLLTALPGRGFTAIQTVGIMVLVAFSPPLLNLLLNGPQNVYEDASVYALLTSLAIFVAMLRFIARRQMRDFWVCCILGGMSGLVRPTHGIYGVLGPAICCVLLFRERKIRAATIPLSALIAGMVFLAVSNRIRFGSVTEFGHRETLTNADGEMTSRFVNPISRESPWAAAKELFGALFLAVGDVHKMDMWGKNQFLGQAPCFRWRDFYVTAFDPTLFLIAGAGLVAGVWVSFSGVSSPRKSASISCAPLAWVTLRALVVWGTVSFAMLFLFMMYYPGLSSRYLYDFWPALLAFASASWIFMSMQERGFAAVVFVSWLVFQLCRMDCRERPLEASTFALARAPVFERDPIRLRTAGKYDADHPAPNGIAQFCDFPSELARFIIRVPVDAPQFIELVVSRRELEPGLGNRRDIYQARIANHKLPLLSILPEPGTRWIHVRFGVPSDIRAEANDELLFVCFVAIGDEQDQWSERAIKSIRWR